MTQQTIMIFIAYTPLFLVALTLILLVANAFVMQKNKHRHAKMINIVSIVALILAIIINLLVQRFFFR